MYKPEIVKFVRMMGRYQPKLGSAVHNQYLNDHLANNLIRYLDSCDSEKGLMVIGEAPGYRGCNLTGIPFTDYFTLARLGLKNPNYGPPLKEQSATFFWEVFNEVGIKPITHNMFPFHPYEAGSHLSNRKPTNQEVEDVFKYTKRLMDIFKPTYILCIGKVAFNRMEAWQITETSFNPIVRYVRHPAQGGKNLFQKGVKDFVNEFDI